MKQARDTDILKGSGYADEKEFAWSEYKLDASQVSRYIKTTINFQKVAIPRNCRISTRVRLCETCINVDASGRSSRRIDTGIQ